MVCLFIEPGNKYLRTSSVESVFHLPLGIICRRNNMKTVSCHQTVSQPIMARTYFTSALRGQQSFGMYDNITMMKLNCCAIISDHQVGFEDSAPLHHSIPLTCIKFYPIVGKNMKIVPPTPWERSSTSVIPIRQPEC